MYYRVGCHLCDEMVAHLRYLQREVDFDFVLVDIDKNDELRDRYNVDVPVVARDGEVVCYHFFEEKMVRQALLNG